MSSRRRADFMLNFFSLVRYGRDEVDIFIIRLKCQLNKKYYKVARRMNFVSKC